LAVEFIKLATSKDNLRYGSNLTPRKDIAELDEYNQLTYQEKMTDFLEFTNYRPTYDEYPEVSSSIQSAVEAVTTRSEEHTSELQSRFDLVCRLLLENKK